MEGIFFHLEQIHFFSKSHFCNTLLSQHWFLIKKEKKKITPKFGSLKHQLFILMDLRLPKATDCYNCNGCAPSETSRLAGVCSSKEWILGG